MRLILQTLLKHKLVTDETAGKVRSFIAANQTFKAGEASKKKEEAAPKPKRCRAACLHHSIKFPLCPLLGSGFLYALPHPRTFTSSSPSSLVHATGFSIMQRHCPVKP